MMKEGAGLLACVEGILEIRLSQEDLGRESSRSVEPSLSVVLGICLPYLLEELPRDSVQRLAFAEACSGSLRVLRRKSEVDRRGSVVCSGVEARVVGWETVRRGGAEEEVDRVVGK